MRRKPIAIDLFCGAGGLTLGLKQAGFRVVGAVELDAIASKTYTLNHARTKLWRADIRTISGSMMMKTLDIERGDLDLLAACPPCQGFSTMRTKNGRRGNSDRRNDLVYEVLRLVRSMRPKCMMMENVPRLADDSRFERFVFELQRLGYFTNWQILNAADYGVPQRRRRLVLLASRTAMPQFARAGEARRTVRQTIGRMRSPNRSRDSLHNYKVARSKAVWDLIKRIPRDGGSREALGPGDQLRCHRKIDGFRDVYGRMSWDQPAPTITGGCINPSKGRFLHPQENRAMTLREAALLQTFPRAYRFPLDKGRYAVALLIGNALPPEFIRRQALALLCSGLPRTN